MINSKKVFVSALGLLLAANINNANAQYTPGANEVDEPAVLFKIHDVKPVVGSDGQTSSCDFVVTFFNRTTDDINGASIDLTWEDESIKALLSEEGKDSKSRTSSVVRNTTESVTTNVEVPTTKSFKQTSVKSRLQSDRCFLLMDNVKTRVRSCNISSQARAGARSATVCGNLFKFVSSNDPEYYREFSSVSIKEETEKNTQEREKVKKEINEEYTNTVAEFEKASQLLKEIR